VIRSIRNRRDARAIAFSAAGIRALGQSDTSSGGRSNWSGSLCGGAKVNSPYGFGARVRLGWAWRRWPLGEGGGLSLWGVLLARCSVERATRRSPMRRSLDSGCQRGELVGGGWARPPGAPVWPLPCSCEFFDCRHKRVFVVAHRIASYKGLLAKHVPPLSESRGGRHPFVLWRNERRCAYLQMCTGSTVKLPNSRAGSRSRPDTRVAALRLRLNGDSQLGLKLYYYSFKIYDAARGFVRMAS